MSHVTLILLSQPIILRFHQKEPSLSGFESRGRHHQKSETGVLMVLQKGFKNFMNEMDPHRPSWRSELISPHPPNFYLLYALFSKIYQNCMLTPDNENSESIPIYVFSAKGLLKRSMF